MRTTNLTLTLMLALLACGPPSSGPDGGADGGAPPGDGGDPPAFVEGPSVLDPNAQSFALRLLADRTVTATAQWRSGGRMGEVTGGAASTEHVLGFEGLDPGRTVEIGVSIRAADGQVATRVLTTRTALLPGGPYLVLFDAAHGQEAGNADWIIDDGGRFPSPTEPTDEEDWRGAYSAFGVDLHRSGRFRVENLPDGRVFRHGTSDAQDLSKYDVLVIPEPNSPLVAGEAQAVAAFVRAGGGVLMIGNHGGADRDNDGWDAVTVLNGLLGADAYGIRLAGDGASGTAVGDAAHPVIDGPFGMATRLGAFVGSTLSLDPVANPSVRTAASIPGRGTFIAASTLGAGRLVVHGDSSAADDGTDSGGNQNIYDAWHDPEQDNAAFFLNATSWLAGEY